MRAFSEAGATGFIVRESMKQRVPAEARENLKLALRRMAEAEA